MAKQEKKSFPMFPVKHWWTLRKKFKQSIPGTVTPNYLSGVLNMKENSARDNVYLYLKQIKIINEKGTPTDRATKWRDDHEYKKVCESIVKEIYPQELVDAVPDPSKNKASAERWFAKYTGAGEVAVKKMVACYIVLSHGDASKAPKQSKTKAKERKKPAAEKKPLKPAEKKQNSAEEKGEGTKPDKNKNEKHTSPEICVNLQIHISSDASTDQIDQIFASMAKHIYPK